ncbi:MAG: sulfatase-like hydrolase/transferase, partial [Candidatus Latescibacteria bacterium]|nr:sulfatase-like hydrolase/transferase [Candidatus Latescibacterota bacterium]
WKRYNVWMDLKSLTRLAARGVSFMESYSANPVCTPARAALFTGRTTCETGVIANEMGIRSDIPNLGQWLGGEGYETVYCGKWHVPRSYSFDIPGFTVLPGGLGGQGTLGDQAVSSACEGYLHNHKGDDPFLLVASFLQPHDVCNWVQRHRDTPDELPFPEIEDELPPFPDNFVFDPREPKTARFPRVEGWSERQWRYYIWSYYRMVEEVDYEIGRALQALDDSGQADDTIVIFASDHGEGRGRHQTVTKNFMYEESVKVPLILAGPGVPENVQDSDHLISGLDVMATMCDYAGIEIPEHNRGFSLRSIVEDQQVEWRDFVVAEVARDHGRMIRTRDYKLIAYRNDPVTQLFDMKNDPGETVNLAGDEKYVGIFEEHRNLLETWEAQLDHAPNALPPFKVAI